MTKGCSGISASLSDTPSHQYAYILLAFHSSSGEHDFLLTQQPSKGGLMEREAV